ncbi:MAG TPA: hypothetical protein VMT11_12430 [Myxococcaceae bacterium]|nr:hypothetical protein [Myxococcaceae bacterium]
MSRTARALIAASLVTATTARAGAIVEEIPATPPRRSLGAHLFIPREGVTDPFTASFVASSSSVASGTANGPTFDRNGKPINIEDYKILFYSQLFTGQWGIADFWALRLRMLGSIYTGTNTAGAVGVGVNGLVRASAGTTFGFQIADNLRLGVAVDVAWGPSVAISILDSIRESISAGSVQTPVESSYSTTVTPTLSLAWTISRGWGALFNVTYANGVVDVNQASTDADMVLLQGALDVDLRELGSIPLGIAADYSAGYSAGRARFRRYVAGLGFFYTGRPGLTVGLDLSYRRSPLGTHDVFVTSFSGTFSLRFTFD